MPTPKVIMYTTPTCGFCRQAEMLLKQHYNVVPQKLDISSDGTLREQMMNKSGGAKTVPQIFINDHHVGGFKELQELHNNKTLPNMLQ
jgi:glutaredoxin 3